MRTAKDPDLVTRSFEAALADTRSTFSILRRDTTSGMSKKRKGQCKTWFERKDKEGREDELVAWAWQTRDNSQHDSTSLFSQNSFSTLSPFNSDDLRPPPGFVGADLIINATGMWFVRDGGTTRERRARPLPASGSRLPCQRYEWTVADGPKVHQGEPIDRQIGIDGLVELAIDWTQDVIDEAHVLWGGPGMTKGAPGTR